jgi:hypothetical protein
MPVGREDGLHIRERSQPGIVPPRQQAKCTTTPAEIQSRTVGLLHVLFSKRHSSDPSDARGRDSDAWPCLPNVWNADQMPVKPTPKCPSATSQRGGRNYLHVFAENQGREADVLRLLDICEAGFWGRAAAAQKQICIPVKRIELGCTRKFLREDCNGLLVGFDCVRLAASLVSSLRTGLRQGDHASTLSVRQALATLGYRSYRRVDFGYTN